MQWKSKHVKSMKIVPGNILRAIVSQAGNPNYIYSYLLRFQFTATGSFSPLAVTGLDPMSPSPCSWAASHRIALCSNWLSIENLTSAKHLPSHQSLTGFLYVGTSRGVPGGWIPFVRQESGINNGFIPQDSTIQPQQSWNLQRAKGCFQVPSRPRQGWLSCKCRWNWNFARCGCAVFPGHAYKCNAELCIST